MGLQESTNKTLIEQAEIGLDLSIKLALGESLADGDVGAWLKRNYTPMTGDRGPFAVLGSILAAMPEGTTLTIRRQSCRG